MSVGCYPEVEGTASHLTATIPLPNASGFGIDGTWSVDEDTGDSGGSLGVSWGAGLMNSRNVSRTLSAGTVRDATKSVSDRLRDWFEEREKKKAERQANREQRQAEREKRQVERRAQREARIEE